MELKIQEEGYCHLTITIVILHPEHLQTYSENYHSSRKKDHNYFYFALLFQSIKFVIKMFLCVIVFGNNPRHQSVLLI